MFQLLWIQLLLVFALPAFAVEVCETKVAAEAEKLGIPYRAGQMTLRKSPVFDFSEQLQKIQAQIPKVKQEFSSAWAQVIHQYRNDLTKTGVPRKLFSEETHFLLRVHENTEEREKMNDLAKALDALKAEKKSAIEAVDWMKSSCVDDKNSKSCKNSKIRPEIEYSLYETQKLYQKKLDAIEAELFRLLKENGLDRTAAQFPYFTTSQTYRDTQKEYPAIIVYFQDSKPLGIVIKRNPYDSEFLTEIDASCNPKVSTLELAGIKTYLNSKKACQSIGRPKAGVSNPTLELLDDRCRSLFDVPILKTATKAQPKTGAAPESANPAQ